MATFYALILPMDIVEFCLRKLVFGVRTTCATVLFQMKGSNVPLGYGFETDPMPRSRPRTTHKLRALQQFLHLLHKGKIKSPVVTMLQL